MNADELAGYAKAIAGAMTLGTIAFTGWNLYLQGKLREISALWRWKDGFIQCYQEDRLMQIEKFATKVEMKESFDRLDHHLEEIRRSVDRLRDRLEPRSDRDA